MLSYGTQRKKQVSQCFSQIQIPLNIKSSDVNQKFWEQNNLVLLTSVLSRSDGSYLTTMILNQNKILKH